MTTMPASKPTGPADAPTGCRADYQARLRRAAEVLRRADYLLIGGGAGLSEAAGLHYAGQRFTNNFAPFIARYGFADMYSAGFYPFATPEEKWAYWAKHISLNRHEMPATELYKRLFGLARGKEYFVLTTNVDGQFHKAGFPEDKVFAVQGDYGYFQCARGCHNTLYANQAAVAQMVRQTKDCKIPPELVPACPVCHGPLEVHVHKDRYFVRDQRWKEAADNYAEFLGKRAGKRLALLELGVGYNTPGIIRYPFEELVYADRLAVLVRANRDHPQGPRENAGKTIAFAEDMDELACQLLQALR